MIYPPDNEQWSEAQIQMYIAMIANRFGLLFHADGNGNFVSGSVAAKKKLSGACKGWPDMVFIYNGMVVWIELKTMDGRLSKEQLAVHAKLADNGQIVRVVYALDGKDGWKQVKELIGVRG